MYKGVGVGVAVGEENGSTKVSSKFGVYKLRVFNEILVLIVKPRISDYANREY